MKLLVTGANGFIGKHLCPILCEEGYEVAAVTRSQMSKRNNTTVISKVFSKNTNWTDVLKGVDVIIHLAGRAHLMEKKIDSSYEDYAEINIEATINLAKQAALSGVHRFIFLSSVKVNGERTYSFAFNEIDIPKPEDNYGKTKFEAEESLKFIAKETGMEVVIIRPTLVYGAGVKANFKSLIELSQRNVPLPFGSINNKRSFVYIENLTHFICLCINHTNAANQTFLISDDNDISTTQLIRLIKDASRKWALLVPVPKSWLIWLLTIIGKSSFSDKLCNNLQVDVNKAKTLLNWRPPHTVKEGIAKTLNSFK